MDEKHFLHTKAILSKKVFLATNAAGRLAGPAGPPGPRVGHHVSVASPRSRRCGWSSDFPTFAGADAADVSERLATFVREPSPEQRRAWRDAIPWLQDEARSLLSAHPDAERYAAILEYELPRESRRPDVVVLENGVVVVLELKGKQFPSQADLDQVFAYARDLRCYHAACADRPVHAVLVPTRGPTAPRRQDGVTVVGPKGLHEVLLALRDDAAYPPLPPETFLADDVYAPLPTLVRAARELFHSGTVPRIWRAAAATDPAVERITAIAHEAAKTRTRRLVLLTGVPGAGKTLVGLRLVHAGFLDDLAVARAGGKPTAPAVFLSGNGPLVQVLQDALKDAGGGGKTFVRGVKDYVKAYTRRAGATPPEHLLVFDEAQRAWDADQVARKHDDVAAHGKSEPEHFVEFAGRIPEWCVVVGLIGTGQEIHIGEEGGLGLWRKAVERAGGGWVVHAPPEVRGFFEGVSTVAEERLSLTVPLRHHLAARVHDLVQAVLAPSDAPAAAALAEELHEGGHRFLVTRDLAAARAYARERYAEDVHARYGLLASSRDKDLERFGIRNGFQDTKVLKVGPWFNAPPSDALSCCRLETTATEFQAQGLELDLAVLAWGSDFARDGGRWSIAKARRNQIPVRDPYQLRLNTYRVLLTRGRDGTVVFVPPDRAFDETHAHLVACGMKELRSW